MKNIFESEELDEALVVAKFATTTQHGAIEGKTQTTETKFYNLDAILSVGYRVNSFNAAMFRKWATSVLKMLDKHSDGVNVRILTKSIPPQLQLDIEKHNSQYSPIKLEIFTNSHDRFLCIDDTVYHIGASLKDLGKKWFAFSKMEIDTDSLIGKM